MDLIPQMALGSTPFVAIGMYIDAKHSLMGDFAQIRGARRLQQLTLEVFSKHRNDDWPFYHVVHASYAVLETPWARIRHSDSKEEAGGTFFPKATNFSTQEMHLLQ